MSTKSKQYEGAALWLERSRKDYRAARILKTKDSALSIYLLEQCIEKSIKAIAVSSGKFPPSYIKGKFGHNSKKLLIKLWQKLETNNSSSTFSSICNLAEVTDEEDLFETLRYTEELQNLSLFKYDIILAQNDILKLSLQIDDKEFEFLYEYNESPPSLTLTGPLSTTSERASLLDLAVQLSLDSSMKALVVRSISGKRKIKAELKNQFLREKTLFSLFLLAALTYEHEAWSRYPGENNGCQNYTDNLPIVKHIGLLYKTLDVILPKVDNLLNQIVSE